MRHKADFRVIWVSVLLILSSCAESGMSPYTRDLKIADDEIASGKPASALQLMQKYYEAQPSDVPTIVRLGLANEALERNTTAQILFEKAIGIDPSSDSARKGLIRVEIKTDPHKAILDIKNFYRLRPHDATLLSDLGVAHDLCGEEGDAQNAYRRAMALNPTLISAQANLGLSLALSGHPREALAFLKPLALSPDSTKKLRQDYALAEVGVGDEDVARRILQVDLTTGDVERAINSYKSLIVHAP